MENCDRLSISVRKGMNYVLMPSLERQTLIRIAITLWNQDDIRALTAKFYNFHSLFLEERLRKWQIIENMVLKKVPKLLLPESLKRKILDFIKPIGLEIFRWKECHEYKDCLDSNLPDELCWTPQGTVDKKKTAGILIKNENLDITICYKLACIYCLENDVWPLWNKIPENCRKSFHSEEDPGDIKQHELVVLWTYDIKGEVTRLGNWIESNWRRCTPYQYAFEYAAVVGGNKVATEYFLKKLTSEEREVSLMRTARCVASGLSDLSKSRIYNFPKERHVDVLCFLLSQIDEEQQLEVFKSNACGVLRYFLYWPWQSFFMEIAKCVQTFLHEQEYYYLIWSIIAKITMGYRDHNYQKLLGTFWQQSSNAHKRYVMKFECEDICLLSELFKFEDKENIKLIFKDTTVAEREKIISCNEWKDICERLIHDNKWDLLEFFVQECLSSKEIMIKFKEEFMKHITQSHSEGTLQEEKDMWDNFSQLLDRFIQKDDKEKCVEDNSPAKRLCSTEFEEMTHNM